MSDKDQQRHCMAPMEYFLPGPSAHHVLGLQLAPEQLLHLFRGNCCLRGFTNHGTLWLAPGQDIVEEWPRLSSKLQAGGGRLGARWYVQMVQAVITTAVGVVCTGGTLVCTGGTLYVQRWFESSCVRSLLLNSRPSHTRTIVCTLAW